MSERALRRTRGLVFPLLILASFQPAEAQDTSSCDGICGRRPLASSQHLLRIVGGTNSLPGTWPWHVNFQMSTENGSINACGGTLISPRWIVSAAHCFEKQELFPWIKAVVGNIKLSNPGPDAQQRSIKRVISHGLYQNNLKEVDGGVTNDISLIEMDEPIKCTDYVQPACLPDDSMNVSALTHCYTSGWGTMDVPTQKLPDIQQQVRLDLIPRNICASPYSWYKRILNENLCAGSKEDNAGICQGDSGGPLMCREERSERYWVVGVSSWGPIICGNAQYPGVFTSTQQYLDWMKRKTNENFSIPSHPPLLAEDAAPTTKVTSPKPQINTQWVQVWSWQRPGSPLTRKPTNWSRPLIVYFPKPIPNMQGHKRPGTRPPPQSASTYRPWRTTYGSWTRISTWQASKSPATWFKLTYRPRTTRPLMGSYSSYNWNWRRPQTQAPERERVRVSP